MRRHPSLPDVSDRRTRSTGPPPPQEPLTHRRKNKQHNHQTPTTSKTVSTPTLNVSGYDQPPALSPVSPVDPHRRTPSPTPPHLVPVTPPPPTMTEAEMNERVKEAMKDHYATLKADREEEARTLKAQRDEEARTWTEKNKVMDAMLQDMTAQRDEAKKDKTKCEQDAIDRFANIINESKKNDCLLQPPDKFSEPELGWDCKTFFQEFEDYCAAKHPGRPEALAAYLPSFLKGKAHTCYKMQRPEIKKSYQAMRDAIKTFFAEKEEDLLVLTLTPFAEKGLPINDYLDYAHHFFQSKRTEEGDVIIQLKTCLTGHLRDAMTINKPKNWVDACRYIRNAAGNNHQPPTDSDKKMRSIANEQLIQYTPEICNQVQLQDSDKWKAMEKQLETLKEKLQQKEDRGEQEVHSVAAMGGGKPTFNKPQKTSKPAPGQWPPFPPGHVVSPRYRGLPEDYDPYFNQKMKKAREQGLIQEGSRYRESRNNTGNNTRYQQQQQQPRPQESQQPRDNYQQQQWQQQPQQQQQWQQQPQQQQQWQQQPQQQQQWQQQPQYNNNTQLDTFSRMMDKLAPILERGMAHMSSAGNQAPHPGRQQPQLQWRPQDNPPQGYQGPQGN